MCLVSIPSIPPSILVPFYILSVVLREQCAWEGVQTAYVVLAQVARNRTKKVLYPLQEKLCVVQMEEVTREERAFL